MVSDLSFKPVFSIMFPAHLFCFLSHYHSLYLDNWEAPPPHLLPISGLSLVNPFFFSLLSGAKEEFLCPALVSVASRFVCHSDQAKIYLENWGNSVVLGIRYKCARSNQHLNQQSHQGRFTFIHVLMTQYNRKGGRRKNSLYLLGGFACRGSLFSGFQTPTKLYH